VSETLELGIGAPGEPEVDLEGVDLEEHLGADDEPDAELVAVEVSELTVRAALAAVGGLMGFALGDRRIPDHWRFTDSELDDLTPPVTRIVNRNPRLARYVAHADAAAAGLVIVRYALRNFDLAKQAKEIHDTNTERRSDLPAAAPAREAGPFDRTQAPRDIGRPGGFGAPTDGADYGDDGTGPR